ncbi:hemagglutinin repeat-containing protein [Pseudorhodoferax sp. LjRoot39]
MLVASRDIVNQGGTVQGQDVALVAARDVRNESLAITQDWSASNAQASVVGSHTGLSNTARIEAGRTLQIQAGQDVQDTAGHIATDGTASVQAGRDIVFGTLDSGHDSRMQMGRASVTSSSRQAHAGQIGAGDDLVLSAGRDLQLNGTQAHAGGDARAAKRLNYAPFPTITRSPASREKSRSCVTNATAPISSAVAACKASGRRSPVPAHRRAAVTAMSCDTGTSSKSASTFS